MIVLRHNRLYKYNEDTIVNDKDEWVRVEHNGDTFILQETKYGWVFMNNKTRNHITNYQYTKGEAINEVLDRYPEVILADGTVLTREIRDHDLMG
jgi:hypothetical protein